MPGFDLRKAPAMFITNPIDPLFPMIRYLATLGPAEPTRGSPSA